MSTKKDKLNRVAQRFFYIDDNISSKWCEEQITYLHNAIRRKLKAEIHQELQESTTDYVTIHTSIPPKNHPNIKMWSWQKLLEELKVKVVKKKPSSSQESNLQLDSQPHEQNTEVPKVSTVRTANAYVVLHDCKNMHSEVKYFYPLPGSDRYNFPTIDRNSHPSESPFASYIRNEELVSRLKKEQKDKLASSQPSPAREAKSLWSTSPERNAVNATPSNIAPSSSSNLHGSNSTVSGPITPRYMSNARSSSAKHTYSTKDLPFCHVCNFFFDSSIEEHREEIQHQTFALQTSNYSKIDAFFETIREDRFKEERSKISVDQTVKSRKSNKRRRINSKTISELSEILGSPPTSDEDEDEKLKVKWTITDSKYLAANNYIFRGDTWKLIKNEPDNDD